VQGGNCYADKNDSYNRISRFRGALLVRRLRRFRGDEFLETRIIPEWIEHRVEPEERGSKRCV